MESLAVLPGRDAWTISLAELNLKSLMSFVCIFSGLSEVYIQHQTPQENSNFTQTLMNIQYILLF